MNLLLDTCSMLWGLQDPMRLSAAAREALENPQHRVQVSAVSFWEISLKFSLGKLEIEGAQPDEFPRFVMAAGWDILPLEGPEAAGCYRLPKVNRHKDPFDRILVWIALAHGFHLVSRDRAMRDYEAAGLKVLW